MRSLRTLSSTGLLLLAIAGCGGSGSGAVLGDTTDAATVTGKDAHCTSSPNNAPNAATIEMKATHAPDATDGAIPQGELYLAAITIYTGDDGTSGTSSASLRGTLVVKGSVVEQALDGDDGQKPISQRSSATITTAGTTATVEQTCPSPTTSTSTFSATPSSLSLFTPDDVGRVVELRYER